MSDASSAGPGAAPVSRGAAWKIVLSVVVITGAVGYLLKASVSGGAEYYKHVDEVMTQPTEWYGKKLQLHGYVVPDSIMWRKNSLEYKFKVQSNGQVVNATYTGVVPDTFKSDAEVVLKGTLSPDGLFTFSPNGVMAKCPSKYEAKPGNPTS
jgi:cytochrome c-type biogenesis protein CcmE